LNRVNISNGRVNSTTVYMVVSINRSGQKILHTLE